MSTADLSGLNKKVQQLVRLALDVGWTAHNVKQRSVLLVSPVDDKITLELPPVKQINGDRLESWRRRIYRYSDRVKLATLSSTISTVEGGPDPAEFSLAWQGYEAEYKHEEAPTTVTNPETTLDVIVKQQNKAHIIAERPHLAKRGSTEKRGRAYESDAVIERVWSDGTVDYACTWPMCDYTNPLARAVASHYGSSASHDVKAKQEPTIAIPPYDAEHRVTNRVAKLAGEIKTALDGIDLSSVKLEESAATAWAIAEKMIEERDRTKSEHTDYETGEPLTPEQLLDKIRALVDDGSYFRRLEADAAQRMQIDTLTRELGEAKERAEQADHNCAAVIAAQGAATEELRAAKAEAEREKARWQALTELVNQEATG